MQNGHGIKSLQSASNFVREQLHMTADFAVFFIKKL